MRPIFEIALTGVAAVTMHPLRSFVTVFCLCSVLVPYAVGIAISQGIQWEAQLSIDHGADLYVSGLQFGKQAPIPLSAVAEVEAIEGVTSVVPRVVGGVLLGKEQVSAVLVGLPADSGTHELIVGSEFARRLELKVGAFIPPFYTSDRGERISKVVGIFHADAPFWQSNLIFTTLDAANHIFDQTQLVTDLLVDCRSGYGPHVRERILRDVQVTNADDNQRLRLRVVTREDMQALLPRGLLHREGLFNLHYVLLAVASILVVLVTSGLGLAERSREIGILKATGWQTDEVPLRSFSESLVIALTGALLAVLLAFVWLRFINGWWIAGVFISDAGASPTFTIPYRLAPTPVILTVVLSIVITMTGSLYSAWRAAIATPSSVMR
ncbi:MAG: FtsX-like permease family protein [Planctomycetota bacterium]|nr:FtsX-like permease family protein [Planctomycetota bacterium]